MQHYCLWLKWLGEKHVRWINGLRHICKWKNRQCTGQELTEGKKKTNKYLNSQSFLSGSLLLSESSPMTQAGLCVFRLISMTWLSRSESRLHPAPITCVGGKPLCLQATWVIMSTGESEWPYVIYIMSRAVSRRRVCCCYRPGCDAISITALGLRRARLGIIPLYKSTLVCTTVTYDCSLLHAFAVTTTTLEPAEAEISSTAETMVINSCRPVTAKLVKEKHKA